MKQKIGYIRVSSEGQNLARQQSQLQEIGVETPPIRALNKNVI